MNKKNLLVLLCVAALAAVSVMGTLAYLTDRASAVNTFTVGDVDIDLDEEAVTPDGVPTPEDDDRVKENDYHLLPGQTYVKDPTLTVKAGSEESYVRMLVTITKASAVKEVFGDGFLPENYVSGWDRTLWLSHSITEDTDADTITYEFRYFETVDASEATEDIVLDALFDSFTVPEMLGGDDLKKLEGLQILVNGHAIQAVGFDNADAAWAGFDAQMAWDAGQQPGTEAVETTESIVSGEES